MMLARLPLLLLLAICAAEARGAGRDVRGKSIYFVTVDRFARTDSSNDACEGEGWCGGTIRGVTEHVDYIQAMGFDGVWITPVIGQRDQEPIPHGVSMGYHAWYWDEIDSHFGTSSDLKELSRELHRRGMVFVYDIVLNHVGPVNSSAEVHQVRPFNDISHYHTRNISAVESMVDPSGRLGDRDERAALFDAYTGTPAGSWRPAALQGGLGPCAFQCTADGCEYPNVTMDCENYVCAPGVRDSCVYRGAAAAGPPEILRCGVGDWSCPGYDRFDETYVTDGWLNTLGDLNQSHPFVRQYLKSWTRRMAETYDIDMFRLDTAYYMDKTFLQEVQAELSIPILAEVNPTTNMTFHASYQSDAVVGHVADGLLNFPVVFVASAAFCPSLGKLNFYPFANLNLTRLGSDMDRQHRGGLYTDELLLGNFIDNHDYVRIAAVCAGDKSRVFNALAWVMLTKGIPIVYQGTEQEMDKPGGGYNGEDRTSLWQYRWRNTTDTFGFLAVLNRLRKKHNFTSTDIDVVHWEETQLVFTRGGQHGAWVFLNNLPNTTSRVAYNAALPAPPAGQAWASAFTGRAAVLEHGRAVVEHSHPEVLVLQDVTRPLQDATRPPARGLRRRLWAASGAGALSPMPAVCIGILASWSMRS